MAEQEETDTSSALTQKLEKELNLLQRHVTMLKAVIDYEPIGIIRLSEITGYPQHKVRYSLRILEQEGLVEPSAQGAVSTEKLNTFLDELKGILDDMTATVSDLKAAVGQGD